MDDVQPESVISVAATQVSSCTQPVDSRGELSRMNCEHLVMRDGRWVFLDFKGKGNKTRSVAVPLWVKQEIDGF